MRPLGAGDYPAAVEIYRQSPRFVVELNGVAEADIGQEMVEEEAAKAANHGGTYEGLFLRPGGQMIGLASVVPVGFKGHPSQAWIALLLVAEPYQRQGYGSEAYRLIEERVLADPGIRTISLGVLANNGPALGFWQAMGYRRTGSMVPDSDGRDVVILTKNRAEEDEDAGKSSDV